VVESNYGQNGACLRCPLRHYAVRRIRVPCGDHRLQRESARTARIGERRHRGPALRSAQTRRRMSQLPERTPIRLRVLHARCRRPVPAPAARRPPPAPLACGRGMRAARKAPAFPTIVPARPPLDAMTTPERRARRGVCDAGRALYAAALAGVASIRHFSAPFPAKNFRG